MPAPEVVEAMLPWLRDMHANPHADHWHGRRAANALEQARQAIADLIGGQPEGIVFTSGATESNNLALKGLLNIESERTYLCLSNIEHKSLIEPSRYLARQGIKVRDLPVTEIGYIEPQLLRASLAAVPDECGVVAFAHGNNEIGTIQSIRDLCWVAHSHGHIVHVDCAQTAGRLPIAVDSDDIDLLGLSSHKMYGPAGIGALYIAPEVIKHMRPLFHGGGQERGLRAGTVAPFLAVGFGKAAEIAKSRMARDAIQLSALTDAFLNTLRVHIVAFNLIGSTSVRIPGHLSLQFPGIGADDLLALLRPTLSASSGSACSSGELRASYVLRAIGMDEEAANQVIRISIGRETSMENVIESAHQIAKAIEQIRRREM